MTIVVKKVPKAFRGIIKFIFGIKWDGSLFQAWKREPSHFPQKKESLPKALF